MGKRAKAHWHRSNADHARTTFCEQFRMARTFAKKTALIFRRNAAAKFRKLAENQGRDRELRKPVLLDSCFVTTAGHILQTAIEKRPG